MTRRVLITGVSSGIGLAQARLFLENGYQVYGVDQGENPLLEGDFHFLQRDLILDLKPVFDWCPQVDVLCNTAGVLDDYKPLLEQSAQEIQEIFELFRTRPYAHIADVMMIPAVPKTVTIKVLKNTLGNRIVFQA